MARTKRLTPAKRILAFISGMIISVYILLYSFQFASYPIQVTLAGHNVTSYFIGVMIIMIGITGATLIKSGLLGVWKLD